MVDVELLSRKLAQLRTYVDELQAAEDISWDKYCSDTRAKAFVERYLHLATESVIDIANHLVSFHRWREPKGYRDLFLILTEKGVIPEEEAESFQRMAAFRNLLVHRYGKIEDELVYGVFRNQLGSFLRFSELVVTWVGTPEGANS